MMLIDCYVLIISELTMYVLHGADFKVETFFLYHFVLLPQMTQRSFFRLTS